MITIMIVSFSFFFLPQFRFFGDGMLTVWLFLGDRSDRQRLRTLQIRGFGPEGLRRLELALVCGSSDLLRAQSRHGFQGGVLQVE